jgi:hypothetical protein
MVIVPLAGLMLLVACQPQERELPFETIERRRDWPGSGKEREARDPGLMIIAASEDLIQIDTLLTQEVQTQLREIDFGAYFAIAAFLGHQGSGHEGIDVEQIVRRGDDVLVYVQVGNLTGDLMETSPYHLVKIRKEGNWNQTLHFRLYLDGTEATSLSHFVP